MSILKKVVRDALGTANGARSSAASLGFALLGSLPMLGMSTVAISQEAAEAAHSGPVPSVEELVVTGTRIVRDGYDAPTPVSVMGAEDLKATATTQIAESINRMPVFSGSMMAGRSSAGISAGVAGTSFLNLRGLGSTRTLVLLDGARVVGAAFDAYNMSAVDVGQFPAPLISRVEVVTGGASAAYGSDAVAGVVNFVLDKEFTGFKSEVSGGATTHGDNDEYKVNLTAGTPFAGGRGHFLFSAEHNYTGGIVGIPRSWIDPGYQIMVNPGYSPSVANGEPQFLVRDHVALATAAPGGLFNSGPLRGTAFGQGGTPYQLDYGQIGGQLMEGGDWQTTRIDNRADLSVRVASTTAFSRASFDLTDNVQVYGQVQWGKNENSSNGPRYFFLSGLNIAADNAFLPDSVRQSMVDNGVSSVAFGTTNADLPSLRSDVTRIFRRYVVGATGTFGSDWGWDAYVQRSTNNMTNRTPDNIIRANYNRAIDAVVDPGSGNIVCRSTLSTPDDGCVPYNVLGVGVASEAGKEYVLGDGWVNNLLKQDSAGASVHGEPFATWAGPVSFAAGAEWRRESIEGKATELDEANALFAGNYHASVGDYNVTEGFIETVVPLARDQSWARSLELNGAVRGTDYSTSGYVTTWKVGASYRPIDDVKLRVTRSRDIRAPNLAELFSAGRSGIVALTDPFNDNLSTVVLSRETGNPLLQPEVADTLGVGLVFTPSFLPGFGASIDYFKIDIDDAIATLARQQYIDLCFEGVTALCSAISRDSDGRLSGIRIQPANLTSQMTDGIDIETSYRFSMNDLVSSWRGDVTLRFAGTRVFSLETIDRGSTIEGAGAMSSDSRSAPKFRFLASAGYTEGAFTGTLMARGISSGKLDNLFIECSSGCPESTAAHPTIDRNHVDSSLTFDLALAYKFDLAASEVETFLAVENLTDEDPPVIPGNRSAGYHVGQPVTAYPVLGRILRVGVRVNL